MLVKSITDRAGWIFVIGLAVGCLAPAISKAGPQMTLEPIIDWTYYGGEPLNPYKQPIVVPKMKQPIFGIRIQFTYVKGQRETELYSVFIWPGGFSFSFTPQKLKIAGIILIGIAVVCLWKFLTGGLRKAKVS